MIFEDRASQHTAPRSRALAQQLRLQIRFFPKATPELNAMDHLWKHTKRNTHANRLMLATIDEAVQDACDYIDSLTPEERLRQAGAIADDFWLTK